MTFFRHLKALPDCIGTTHPLFDILDWMRDLTFQTTIGTKNNQILYILHLGITLLIKTSPSTAGHNNNYES